MSGGANRIVGNQMSVLGISFMSLIHCDLAGVYKTQSKSSGFDWHSWKELWIDYTMIPIFKTTFDWIETYAYIKIPQIYWAQCVQ